MFRKFFYRCLFVLSFTLFCMLLTFYFYKPIFTANSIIIPYSLHPYDICLSYPLMWKNIKIYFIIFHFFSYLFCFHSFYSFLKKPLSRLLVRKKHSIVYSNHSDVSLSLLIGKNDNNHLIVLPEKSLYQNILITGTIGSGKTSSCMYPFTKQLISYQSQKQNKQIGMLILDVKGNYYKEVTNFASFSNRLDDLLVLELGGCIKYNPLDKPNLNPIVLANRLKTILTLFSPHQSDSYWLDKVEIILAEAIKFCRLYNDGYVTFLEIHKLITLPEYFIDQIQVIRKKFVSGSFSKKDCYNASSSIDFFQKEFFGLDHRTFSLLQSEITRITNCFINDYEVLHTFCPKKEEINFFGFEDLIQNHKILVLNMNISIYQNLSKIIATYLKLDFQTEVLHQLSKGNCQITAFISDEFHEYCTTSDAAFFAQSREAKCINIVATQSYSSLLYALHDEYATKVIIQNLINKFWFRTDDIVTIENIQKQIGKEDKIKESKTFSENSKQTNYNYFFHTFHSKDSNLSESINEYTHYDYIYDSHFFSQELETFSCLCFLSDGNKILKPSKIKLFPYFQDYF